MSQGAAFLKNSLQLLGLTELPAPVLATKGSPKYRAQVLAGLVDDPVVLAEETQRRAAERAARDVAEVGGRVAHELADQRARGRR
jgi:hypothetical protein